MFKTTTDQMPGRKASVYCSHAENTMDYCEQLSGYISKKNKIAVNPFKVLKQFKLEDLAPLIMKCDELWVFGESEQMLDEKVSFEVKEWKKLKGGRNIKFVTWKDAGIKQ